MAGRDPGGDVRPLRHGGEDLAPGEDQHGKIVAWDEAQQQKEDQIAPEDQKPTREHLSGVPHFGKEPCNDGGEDHNRDAVETGHRSEEHGPLVPVDGGHVQRHDEVVLTVGGGIEGPADQIEQQKRIRPKNGEDADALLFLLVRSLLVGVLHGADIPDQEGNEQRRKPDGDAADQEAQPQVVLEQKSGDGGGEDQPQIAAQVHQGVSPLPILGGGKIREEGVVGRPLDTLEDSGCDEERDRSHPQGDRRADQKAEDADAVAGHDQPFLVESVGQPAADQAGRQHDQTGAHEEIRDLLRREAHLLAEDHGHHGPDHAAEIRDDPSEKENVNLPPQPAVLIEQFHKRLLQVVHHVLASVLRRMIRSTLSWLLRNQIIRSIPGKVNRA